jgi:hypothetical protein
MGPDLDNPYIIDNICDKHVPMRWLCTSDERVNGVRQYLYPSHKKPVRSAHAYYCKLG